MNSEYDVIIVGSGGGALAAAITARLGGSSALVIEKTPLLGGATALSGGGVWIPDNVFLREAGVKDSAHDIWAYLQATVGNRVAPERLRAYVEHGQAMMQLFHDRTRHMRFSHMPGYSDYYPERPGGKPQGRSVEPLLFDLNLLGETAKRLRPPNMDTKGFAVGGTVFHDVNMLTRTWSGKVAALKMGVETVISMLSGKKLSALGQALVGRLLASLKDLGGMEDVYTDTAFVRLLTEGDRVSGVTVRGPDGQERQIRARRGVLLAAGGFSQSQPKRERYLPQPTQAEWSSAPEGQSGDILGECLRLGAALDLMERVWGAPTAMLGGQPAFLVAERAQPGMIIVNSVGERYLNEALPYHEFVDRMYASDRPEARTVPSWLVMDRKIKDRYIFGGLFPGQPFPKEWLESGDVLRADTLSELARLMNMAPAALEATVRRFNALARAGVDVDFGRGQSAYDRYYGDPSLPNPNLEEILTPPFYATRVYPGDIGTKGGVLTDEWARVLRENGQPIAGLYATGNCASAVMGETYPGPGATIGPSMAFGYAAVQHMLGGQPLQSAAR
ncbi:MAG: FAD-binding protein [Deinococcus sp.]|uniref:FAD-binding protein n=1 Tax=Deinococcus sp. TaxID=47478 RepID=UPI0026DCFFA4|nr:FAD-binding protein [Deinococcus sp.]MDO4244964.1 FAD-binding protein [Deinococcus sp.]